MYESFFGMEHTPFVRDVPPEKLFESNAFRETLGRLAYVADRQMFAVVTKDCEAYGIYAGIPAKKIGVRNNNLQYEFDGRHDWFL